MIVKIIVSIIPKGINRRKKKNTNKTSARWKRAEGGKKKMTFLNFPAGLLVEFKNVYIDINKIFRNLRNNAST